MPFWRHCSGCGYKLVHLYVSVQDKARLQRHQARPGDLQHAAWDASTAKRTMGKSKVWWHWRGLFVDGISRKRGSMGCHDVTFGRYWKSFKMLQACSLQEHCYAASTTCSTGVWCVHVCTVSVALLVGPQTLKRSLGADHSHFLTRVLIYGSSSPSLAMAFAMLVVTHNLYRR